MSITPVSPDQAARGKVKTWVTSQWKLCASRVSSQWKSTDNDPIVPVTFDQKDLGKRSEKLVEALTAISGGRFEPERSDRTCPFCPAFFTCGPIAEGGLKKIFD